MSGFYSDKSDYSAVNFLLTITQCVGTWKEENEDVLYKLRFKLVPG
jgi:hypothetical protein